MGQLTNYSSPHIINEEGSQAVGEINLMFVLFIVLIFVIGPLGLFIHESGHLIGGLLRKADTIHLSIGSGKVFSTIRFKKLMVSIHTIFFIGGIAQSNREKPFTRVETIFITLCGPLTNCFVALFLQFSHLTHVYITIFVFFNYWLALINLIPFRLGNKESDGYQLIKLAFFWEKSDIS